MSGESARGRFAWHDLMTTDPEAAQAFYKAVMGWDTQKWEAPGMDYTMWTAGERAIGGTMKLPDEAVAGGARPHWLTYVEVPDVDATTNRARELGATVMVPPSDIPTVGRYAVMADPQGVLFAVYAPESPSPESEREGMAPMGELSWHELATTDPEAALAFYMDLFGWDKVSAVDMGEMGFYHLYGRRGQNLGGIYKRRAEQPGPPAWLPYGRVADVHAATEAVRKHGGQVLHGPLEVPGGDWITMVLDAQGAPFAVHQVKSA